MVNNAKAARARAEASFKTPETDRRDDPGQAAERALREKTERAAGGSPRQRGAGAPGEGDPGGPEARGVDGNDRIARRQLAGEHSSGACRKVFSAARHLPEHPNRCSFELYETRH